MITKDIAETLKGMLAHRYSRDAGALSDYNTKQVWYASSDNVHTIARILSEAGMFCSQKDVIYYFEKPWKWETDMQELVDEFEKVQKC